MRRLNLLRRHSWRQRFQVGDDGDGVLVFQMISVHRLAQWNSIGADTLLENYFALRFGIGRKAGDPRGALGPVRIMVNRDDPDGSALQPARVVELAVRVARRMAFSAFCDFLDEVTSALDWRLIRGHRETRRSKPSAPARRRSERRG